VGDRIRVGIITQEDPFFLGEAITYFLSTIPDDEIEVVVAVVFSGSPFGKKMTFRKKAFETLAVFGFRFFIYYAFHFVLYKSDPKRSVKRIFRESRIPVIENIRSINTEAAIKRIMQYKPDLFVSIGGNQIFKKKMIEAAPRGMLNVHTALLPKYRGLMPTFWVLKNDEQETGVSVFFVDEGIDTGDIVVQKKIAINDRSHTELIRATKLLCMDALIEAILAIKADCVTLIPNPDELSTHFHFPTRQDVKAFYRKGKKFF